MKKVEAIIRPYQVDTLKSALQEVGIKGITRRGCRWHNWFV